MSTFEVEIAIRPKGKSRRPGPTAPPCAVWIPRITRLMALAVKFQDMVDRGEVGDYADLSRLGYVSRARLTQIMNLLLLAPDLQESLLFLSANDDVVRETSLRPIAALPDWRDQRRYWRVA